MQVTTPYRPPAYTSVTRPLLRFFAGCIFRALGNVRVIGRENVPVGQAYLVAINHVSIFDPPAVLVFWPEALEAISAVDVFERPIQGKLLRLYSVMPVHRGDYDRALMERIFSILSSGRPLLIAPEGGRSHATAMRRAKPGVGFILQKACVPVVPVGLVGTTGDYLKRGLGGKRPNIEIRIGRPVQLAPAQQDSAARRQARQENADLIMSYVAGLLPEEYRGVYSDSAIPPA